MLCEMLSFSRGKALLSLGCFCLVGCPGDINSSDPPPSRKAADIQVETDRSEKPLSISVLNRGKNSLLNLSDKIAFHGFAESGLFENKKSEKSVYIFISGEDTLPPKTKTKIQISTLCTTVKGKFNKDIYLTRYSFHFSVMDLIPPALLFQGPEFSSSCSFSFIVTDTAGGEHRFSLKQLPIASIPENTNLSILNGSGRSWSALERPIISQNNMDDFFLISRIPRPYQTLAVFCDRSSYVMKFPDTPAVPVFRLLYTTQNPLPDGKQNCRILSRTKRQSTGITRVFQIDFSSFTAEPPILKWSDLKVRLNLTPPEPFFQPGKWRHYTELEFEDLFLRFPKEPIDPDYTEPHLSALFEVEGLPKDFFSAQRPPVKIRTDTQCVSEAFSEKSVTQSFHFNLTPYIPLMSVTPLEAFQMTYPDRNAKNDDLPASSKGGGEGWSVIHKNYVHYPMRTNKKFPVKCSYRFHFQDLKTMRKFSLSPLVYNIQWNGAGLGLGYDHGALMRGFPVFYEEITAAEDTPGDILFVFQSFGPSGKGALDFLNEDESYSLALNCGRGLKRSGRKSEPFEIKASVNGLSDSFPLSLFFTHPKFKDYTKKQSAVKCRALLYGSEGRLLYFSPEIQILRKTKLLRQAVRFRDIKYPGHVDDDFIWYDLLKFFFTL